MNEASIFAILDTHHHIQGTGFLVADKLGVTCTHVVRSCGKAPCDNLDIHFLDAGETITVRVMPEYWYEDEDVAFLSFTQEASLKKAPLHLRAAYKSIDASVKSYGFPDTPTQGLYAQGTVLGLVKDGKERELVQLNSTEITKGFSGAPIWDTQTYQVVGMVTAVLKADNLGRLDQVAFASPSETLVKLYPFLSLHDPAGELVQGITRLPFGYDTRIKNFITDYLEAPFGGREADMAALDAWLTTLDAPPYALLAAEAGRGKSALLVQWIQTVQARNLAEIAFVPVSLRYNTAQATTVFTSLAVRLGVVYQEHTPYAQLSAEEWKSVCAKYLERTPPEGKPILVILDGLDEATDWQAGADLFPAHPTEGVRVLVSARYQAGDVDAKGWLNRLGWEKAGRAQAIPLDYLTENGVRDVLEKMGNPLDKLATQVDFVHELFRLSEGDPLLVRLYVEALLPYGDQAAQLNSEDLTGLETGLGGFFDRWWEDQKKQWGKDNPLKVKYVATTLNLLACALAPLSKADILELAPPESELNIWTLEDALNALSRFVIGDGETIGYAFSHPRLGYYFYNKLKAEHQKWEQYYQDYGKRTLETLNQKPRDLPEFSPYPVQTYGAHLERAQRPPQDFYDLVSEGWMRAWYKLEGTYSGFLTDVDRAWKLAEKDWEFGLQIKCMLCHSSVGTMSLLIEPDLLQAALEYKQFSYAQALVIVENNHYEEIKVEQLVILAKCLPSYLIEKIFSIAQNISDHYWRAYAILKLYEFLPDDLVPKANLIGIKATSQITEIEKRINTLVFFIPTLSADLQSTVLEEALLDLQHISNEYARAQALIKLAPLVSSKLIYFAYKIAQNLSDEGARVFALTNLVPYLPPEMRSNLFTVIQKISDVGWRAKALTKLRSYLPSELFPIIVETSLNISDEGSRVRAITGLAPILTTDSLSVVFQAAQQLSNDYWCARALTNIFPYLNDDQMPVVLQTVENITDEKTRFDLLSDLFPNLPDNHLSVVLETILKTSNDELLTRTIGKIANHLPPDLISFTLQRALKIQDEVLLVKNLINLAPFLETDRLTLALSLVMELSDEYIRARGLTDFIQFLPVQQRDSYLEAVLNSAQHITNEKDFTDILVDLASYLPYKLLKIDFHLLLSISDEYGRIRALGRLFRVISPYDGLLKQALHAILDISNDLTRARTLTDLIPYLSDELLSIALQSALSASQRIYDPDWQVQVFVDLIPSLYTIQQPLAVKTILKIAFSIHEDYERVIAITDLVPFLTDEWLSTALKNAIIAIQTISDESKKVNLLKDISPYLSSDLIPLALQIVQNLSNETERAQALIEMAPYLHNGMYSVAIEIAKTVTDEYWYFHLLTKLTPYLPSDQQYFVLQAVQNVFDESNRAQIISDLIPYLSTDTVGFALELCQRISDEWVRANILARLSPYLSKESLFIALELVENTADEGVRVSLLSDFAPLLAPEGLSMALDIIQNISDDAWFLKAFAEITPLLHPDLLLRAFKIAQEIPDVACRSNILTNFVPYFSSELIPLMLQTLPEIHDDTTQAIIISSLIQYLSSKEAYQVFEIALKISDTEVSLLID